MKKEKEITININNILDILDEVKFKNIGLLSGKSGKALFYYFAWKKFKVDKFRIKLIRLIDEIIRNLENNEISYSLTNGIVGIASLFQILINDGFLSSDYADLLDQLDVLIEKATTDLTKYNHWDYLHGSLGGIQYLIEKDNTLSIKKKIVLLTNHLLKNRIEYNQYTYWLNQSTKKSNEPDSFSLGIAHGQSSMLFILIKLYEKNYIIDQTPIIQLINWLLRFKYDINDSKKNSIFPSRIINNKPKDEPSRLGWCTGDLGVLNTLFFATKKMKMYNLNKEVLSLLIYSTRKRDLEYNYVVDYSICHGVSGIVLIYQILYDETKLKVFKNAFIYWLSILLKNDKKFIENMPDKYNFLEGITGVGMVLLSTIGGENSWSKFFALK